MNASLFARQDPSLIEEYYESWKNDSQSVDALWAAYFDGYELGSEGRGYDVDAELEEPVEQEFGHAPNVRAALASVRDAMEITGVVDEKSSEFRGRITLILLAYRVIGHIAAAFNPLKYGPRDMKVLEPSHFGLSEEDLDREVNILAYKHGKKARLRDILDYFRRSYCGGIGFEFMHINDLQIRRWMEAQIGKRADGLDYGVEQRLRSLMWLLEAEGFEEFLGKKFLGEKRFSLQGGEGLLVLLNALLLQCPSSGVSHIEMGMAHRGRLNVLANLLKRDLRSILYQFTPGYLPETNVGGGDVKYHLGYENERVLSDGKVLLSLSANPSHLEAVDPVVEGRARARQTQLNDLSRQSVLPLLMHGDAAFAGQGLVSEVLNLSQLKGYRTGGTIHIIINNQIGFTTRPEDARSSSYATDVAKILEAPILHVNGEEPDELIWAAEFALAFRQKFARDIVLDMYCMRRLGHNENDQASFTDPIMVRQIEAHPKVSDIYAKRLEERGELDEVTLSVLQTEIWDAMEEQYERLVTEAPNVARTIFTGSTAVGSQHFSHELVHTGMSRAYFDRVSQALLSVPEGFTLHPTLEKRFLQRRKESIDSGTGIDWSLAESLAWGSLLLDSYSIRLSGQDCRRGTFSQRHAVMYDYETRERWMPLESLATKQTEMTVYNSSLSEASILGFEYGFSLLMPRHLVMWEAQFGDFANGAQVIIDQFIAAAEIKWHQRSGVVLLLPHGYEGAGSEHSSGRIERYLQLCAEENILVMNLTTPAQYFHALRRQMMAPWRKPLVIFTPKSLLSHAEAVSSWGDFAEHTAFQEILADPEPPLTNAKRVIFCTGKVFYDLLAYRREQQITDTLILRIEQIYPLHGELVTYLLAAYPYLRDFCWCQEEPENMGAWSHLRPRLGELLATSIRYAGRPAMACTAEGAKALHLAAQKRLISKAFGIRTITS